METSSGTSVVSYKLAIAGFSPQSSGNGGGGTVTINGIGFPASSSDELTTVSYGAQTSTSSSQFSFVGALTPVLYSISPSVGGTAGGTMVTIMGEGLLPPDGLTTSSHR